MTPRNVWRRAPATARNPNPFLSSQGVRFCAWGAREAKRERDPQHGTRSMGPPPNLSRAATLPALPRPLLTAPEFQTRLPSASHRAAASIPARSRPGRGVRELAAASPGPAAAAFSRARAENSSSLVPRLAPLSGRQQQPLSSAPRGTDSHPPPAGPFSQLLRLRLSGFGAAAGLGSAPQSAPRRAPQPRARQAGTGKGSALD